MNEQEMLARLERQDQRIARLEQRLQEQQQMSTLDLLLFHPFKHAAMPGVKNKVEAGIGIAGRGIVGYGLYRGGAWVVGKIIGG